MLPCLVAHLAQIDLGYRPGRQKITSKSITWALEVFPHMQYLVTIECSMIIGSLKKMVELTLNLNTNYLESLLSTSDFRAWDNIERSCSGVMCRDSVISFKRAAPEQPPSLLSRLRCTNRIPYPSRIHDLRTSALGVVSTSFFFMRNSTFVGPNRKWCNGSP